LDRTRLLNCIFGTGTGTGTSKFSPQSLFKPFEKIFG
jgi:hypothetical protein